MIFGNGPGSDCKRIVLLLRSLGGFLQMLGLIDKLTVHCPAGLLSSVAVVCTSIRSSILTFFILLTY